MSEVFPLNISGILFRTIDESCHIDMDLNLDIKGNVIYNIEDPMKFQSITAVGNSLEGIFKSAIQMAFINIENQKVWIGDLAKENKTIVIPAVLKEIEKVRPIFGIHCEQVILSFQVSQQNMAIYQQLEKMRMITQAQQSGDTANTDSFNVLIQNAILFQEWTCEACGATTKGTSCEYCGTPRKKISFFNQ